MKDEEVIQACSPHAPHKAFADGIGSWSSVRRSKSFDAACCCHPCKTLPEFAVIISKQLFGLCPYGVASRSCCATQGSVGEPVTCTWMTFRDCNSMMKNAKSERKKRSVTRGKSQAQTSAA